MLEVDETGSSAPDDVHAPAARATVTMAGMKRRIRSEDMTALLTISRFGVAGGNIVPFATPKRRERTVPDASPGTGP
jgi:hypothetical protein